MNDSGYPTTQADLWREYVAAASTCGPDAMHIGDQVHMAYCMLGHCPVRARVGIDNDAGQA